MQLPGHDGSSSCCHRRRRAPMRVSPSSPSSLLLLRRLLVCAVVCVVVIAASSQRDRHDGEMAHGVRGVAALSLTRGAARRSLYDDLGVAPTATTTQIRRAFRAQTRQHHPDLHDTIAEKERAKTRMAAVLRAYDVLASDEKRRVYDETGIVPGEQTPTDDTTGASSSAASYETMSKHMTAEQLFRHYHQVSPLLSRTPTLHRLSQLRRIRQFRGNRVFVVLVYRDTCEPCRLFHDAWETFAQSPLVASGVVSLYRIDAGTRAGARLLGRRGLHIHYTDGSFESASGIGGGGGGLGGLASLVTRRYAGPAVFAFVDGQRWYLRTLSDAMQRKRVQMLYNTFSEFVYGFLHDAEHALTTATAGGAKSQTRDGASASHNALRSMRSIVRYLQEPLPNATTTTTTTTTTTSSTPTRVRVLVPPLVTATTPLALALQMRYADMGVHVRSAVPRDALQRFVEDYCGQSIVLRSASGTLVAMPDFVVVATSTLPVRDNTHHTNNDNNNNNTEAAAAAQHEASHAADSVKNDDDSDNDELSTPPNNCPGVHVGVSIALDYAKTTALLRDVVPPPHRTLAGLTYVNAMAFYEVCREHCVLWLRMGDCHNNNNNNNNAAASLDAAVVAALKRDYVSFQTGYVCVHEHAQLHAALQAALTAGSSSSSRNGDDGSDSRSILVAILGGDDTRLHILWPRATTSTKQDDDKATATREYDDDDEDDKAHEATATTTQQSPHEPRGREIDALLADLLQQHHLDSNNDEDDDDVIDVRGGKNASAAGVVADDDDDDDDEGKARAARSNSSGGGNDDNDTGNVLVIAPMATLLTHHAFPLSRWQALYLMSVNVFLLIRPLFSNVLPFIVVYFVHRKYIKHRDEKEKQQKAAAAAEAAAAAARNRSTSTNNSDRHNHNSTTSMSWLFDAARDLRAARTGSAGFLLLVLDDRATRASAVPLPPLATDARFTVRLLPSYEREAAPWLAWAQELQPQLQHTRAAVRAADDDDDKQASASASGGGKNDNDDDDDDERGLIVLAIRKRSLRVAVKAPQERIHDFLLDLLDGTKTATATLPPWASELANAE